VLRKLNHPSLRLFGVSHIALAWMAEDKEWTTEKGGQHNNLASKTVPLLARAAPSVADSGTSGGGMSKMGGMMSGMMGGRGMKGGMGGGGPMGGGPMGGGMMGAMGGGMMGAMGGGMMGGRMNDADAKKQLKTLTRTDFLLQFVWKTPKQEGPPKTEEEQKKSLEEVVTKMTEAQKNNPAVTMPKAEDLQAASLKKSEEVDSKLQNALAPGAGAPGTPGIGGAPGAGQPGVPNGGTRPPAP
jgi:type IV pilus assembly protein PilM